MSISFPSWLHQRDNCLLLDIVVTPRSSRNRIVGIHNQRLKIQLTAPPVDGQANNALIRFLALELKISRAKITIVGGPSNRKKTVRIMGTDQAQIILRLSPYSI